MFSFPDTTQGALGDCYFLSALAVLAARPRMVRRLFLAPDEGSARAAGAHLVRLCKDGAWITVLLDDALPCTASKRLAFSWGKRKQLWVPLLEKAWAKVHGSYAAIERGSVSEALAALTGAPCEVLRLRAAEGTGGGCDNAAAEPDLLWARLLSFVDARFPMGVSCGTVAGQDGEVVVNFKAVGLQSQHAYSLLEVHQVAAYGGQVKLLKIRNPWGRVAWNGAWCETSEMWTPALRAECGAYAGSVAEGVMWIALDDFLKYFDAIDVCKVRPAWTELRFSLRAPPLRVDGAVGVGTGAGGSVSPPPRYVGLPAIAIEAFARTDIEVTLQQASLFYF